jgi:hypothetical protein
VTTAILTALAIVAILAGILHRQRIVKQIIRVRSDRHEHALWLLGALLEDKATLKLMVQTRSAHPELLEALKVRSGEMTEPELLATLAALLRDARTRRVAARSIAKRTEMPEARVRGMLSGMVLEMRGDA